MQGTLADISSLVEESLSVSGVLLAKTMGQTDELTDALRRREPAAWPTSSCASAWRAAG